MVTPRWPVTRIPHSVPVTPGRVSAASRNWIIMAVRVGCVNRRYFKLVLSKSSYPREQKYVNHHEQLGTFDPHANAYGQKMCALNLDRICYHIGQGVALDAISAQLLGLAGLLPQHPSLYQQAWRNRIEVDRHYGRHDAVADRQWHVDAVQAAIDGMAKQK